MDISPVVAAKKDRLVEHRRNLHLIPETGFNEKKTGAYVAQALADSGLEVKTGMAETGVVGILHSGRPGKCLMLRADMDALPVKEETGLSFASTHAGAMHACGHDGHMAMSLTAAEVLSGMKDSFTGSVKFLFQPAEEGPGGAKPMIEAGVLDDPTVDWAVGIHLWPGVGEGHIGLREGPIMAAMDRFDLKIIGKGGHGAMPHLCVDALEVGTQVVAALQRIVSRKMNPLSPTVITVGVFEAGDAYNVIPGTAKLSGTTRTFDLDVWNSLPERMETVIKGVCDSMGASYEFSYYQGYPPTVNDPGMTELVHGVAAEIVGPDRVVDTEPTMGGEDMAFYLERVPGCFVFLGVGREGCAPLHNPKFNFDEEMLLPGVELYVRLVQKLLS